ncbi:MAG: DUF4214 domain-containing protein [Saccharofermentans sp.]|nr:DUF4214 domain-containing protein [Saccharofermentans sp.]
MKRILAVALSLLVIGQTTTVLAADIPFANLINYDVVASDVNSIEAFTANLYTSFLGRVGSVEESQYWINKLRSGSITGVQAVAGFYNSSEYQNRLKTISNEDYIRSLYQGVLIREADSVGIEFWTGKINGGMSKVDILGGFLDSAEFGANCARAGITPGHFGNNAPSTTASTPVPTAAPVAQVTGDRNQVNDFVRRLYTIILNRGCSDTELADWTDKLLSGSVTGSQVIRGFIDSTEFASRNVSNDEFVSICFRAILGREADSVGLNEWTTRLNNGTSRSSIVTGFCGSDEFANLCKNYGITPIRIVNFPQARARLDIIGHDLRAAYNWSVMPYTRNNAWTNPALGSDYYAQIGFANHTGNCYVMAATFYEMAVELGYEAHQVGGMVPSVRGGMTPHSWVEVVIDGQIYVVDPDYQYSTGNSGYMIRYRQPGTWVYSDYQRMN